MPRSILAVSTLLAAALAGGCGTPTETDSNEVVSVTIVPETLGLLRGGMRVLVAVGVDANGNTLQKPATFSSSDTSVATVAMVDARSLLTGVGEGSATITATIDGKQGTAAVMVQVLDPFVSISAGFGHTCALTDVGDAYCWGRNFDGSVGIETTSGCNFENFDEVFGCVTEPVRVSGGLAFQSIAAGYRHSCALTITGQAYCWGDNGTGQLGDSTTTPSLDLNYVPVPVIGGLQFETLSVRRNLTCGVTSSGQAHCWGFGALGDGTTNIGRSYPGPVSGGLQFAIVSAGGGAACGIVVGGAAYCWGQGDRGGIGDGSTFSRPTPVAVSGSLVFQSIGTYLIGFAGFACGSTVSGDSYCWGGNDRGQLGDGTMGTDRTTPVPVAGGLKFQSVVTGNAFACGVAIGGVGYCWGSNEAGQLGDGSTVDQATPVPISGGLTFVTLALGLDYGCGITAAGSIYCWGANDFGQLGNGFMTRSLIPVRVNGSP